MPKLADIELDDLPLRTRQFDAGLEGRFKLPAIERDPVFADGEHISFFEPDAKYWEQVLTHLQLLGYLPDAVETNREAIEAKLALWEKDFRVGRNAGHFRVTLDGEKNRKACWEEARIRYLKAMATFEGEVILQKMPPTGKVCLASRVANMRLVVYGLSRVVGGRTSVEEDLFLASSPFGEESVNSARIGGRIFFGDDEGMEPLRLLNLLGHAPAATDSFLNRRGTSRYLFQGEETDSDLSLARFGINKKPLEWKRRWLVDGDGWSLDDGKRMSLQTMPVLNSRGPSADREMFSALLAEDAKAPVNVVALELLQLRLWMLGYYEGVVDGKWGPLTEKAVEGLVSDNPKAFRSVEAVVRSGWRGWRVVNLYRIFAYIVDYLDIPSERLSVANMNEVSELAGDSLDGDEWEKVENNYADQLEQRSTHVLQGGVLRNNSSNVRRKRYFGWRRFFSAVGSFFREVGTRVGDAARRVVLALKQGVVFAYNIFKYIWRKARIAVRVARLALRRFSLWLFSKPFGTAENGHVVLTRWSFDYDTVQFVSQDCPDFLRTLHGARLDWMSRSLSFMCELGLVVFALLKGVAVVAWLKVAFTIYKRVKSMLADPDYRGLFSERILERGVV